MQAAGKHESPLLLLAILLWGVALLGAGLAWKMRSLRLEVEAFAAESQRRREEIPRLPVVHVPDGVGFPVPERKRDHSPSPTPDPEPTDMANVGAEYADLDVEPPVIPHATDVIHNVFMPAVRRCYFTDPAFWRPQEQTIPVKMKITPGGNVQSTPEYSPLQILVAPGHQSGDAVTTGDMVRSPTMLAVNCMSQASLDLRFEPPRGSGAEIRMKVTFRGSP